MRQDILTKRGLIVLGLSLVIFAGFTGGVWAETFCVNKTGEGGCYTTIQAAVNAAIDWDVIEVGPGYYDEGYQLSVSNSLVIVALAGPQETTIEGSAAAVRVDSNKNVTIRGFNIVGGINGVYVLTAILTLKNNIILGRTAVGLHCHASQCFVINNTISGSGDSGVYTTSANGWHDVIALSNNIISDNGGYGVDLNSDGSESCSYNIFWRNTKADMNSVACPNSETKDPLFLAANLCTVQSSSPTLNSGSLSPADNDPDGTRNNLGACGGPGAASFWPYPEGGPVITELTVTPASVPQGGIITIKATGSVR